MTAGPRPGGRYYSLVGIQDGTSIIPRPAPMSRGRDTFFSCAYTGALFSHVPWDTSFLMFGRLFSCVPRHFFLVCRGTFFSWPNAFTHRSEYNKPHSPSKRTAPVGAGASTARTAPSSGLIPHPNAPHPVEAAIPRRGCGPHGCASRSSHIPAAIGFLDLMHRPP